MPSKRPITIEDLWSLKRIGAPTLSPDGKWACVAVTRYDTEKNEGRSQLWLLSTDGRKARQLTRGKKDSDPQWSPDGKWIAFVSKRADGKDAEAQEQIYRIAADGGEAEPVTDVATGVGSPRWFPDSRRIAFISWVWPGLATPKEQAKRFKADKEDKVKAWTIEANHYRYWDHWFPRGREAHLHVVDAKSGKTADLFAGTNFRLPPQDTDASHFAISPDGGEIAFVHDFVADPGSPSITDIVTLDLATRATRTLTEASGRPNKVSSTAPSYSPDGKWIAFLSTDYSARYNEQSRASLIDRQTGLVSGLTAGWDHGVDGPLLWSADSASLYFTAETEILCPVWRLTLGEAEPVEVVRGPGHGGNAASLAVSADGSTLVYLRSSLAHPPALLAADADGSNERQIERFNAKLLAELDFGGSQSMTYPGFEGEPVQMFVVEPPGYRAPTAEGVQWPLMQVIHGGPHTCMGDVWHWRWNSQLLAASGYVVAIVNYHGSTGRGQDYLSSINGDWGRRELADVEAGTDHLLATGHIDPQPMVATGGSYGGYMVAYMNGHVPEGRYQAYVCHAGCFDWVSMMGSDSHFWLGKELGANPWEDEALVLRQSPHHFAANFKTPTLVIHGELDYRVPYYQGLAYYNTLRVLGVSSRLVFFPDENHWILKPQNSVLWYREFLGWCQRYAGTAAG